MGKHKKATHHPMHRSSEKRSSSQGFYTPFVGLDQHLARTSSVISEETFEKRPGPEVDRHEDGERLFSEAMEGVAPLSRGNGERVPVAPPTKTPPRFFAQEELEAYTQLVDLVAGEGPFELTYSDEYVDGAVLGLSPKILKKLRNGDFSYQEYIDLHGYTREQAREIVVRFIRESFARNMRCVLIVSGRGLNSRDKQPVLKESLVTWLTRAPLKRLVLAFASARVYDGGAGAFYVLLRRNEGKATLVSPAG